MSVNDLTGKKFERILVLKRVENNKFGKARFLCRCDCGTEKIIIGSCLVNGHTKSCGCYSRDMKSNLKHGKSNTRIYEIWSGIKKRCLNKNASNYHDYGGRGIKVCEEWLDKENGFINFYNWSMNNGYSEILTIDRTNNFGNYEPNNCRWVSQKVQNNNKRDNNLITYNGVTKTKTQWSEFLEISVHTLDWRISKKLPVEKILYKGRLSKIK